MKIDIIYRGSIDESPEALAEHLTCCLGGDPSLALAIETICRSRTTRRKLLQLGGAASLTVLGGGLWLPRSGHAQGSLIPSQIGSVDVARPVIPPSNTQTSIAEINNLTDAPRRGVVMADYRANGAITDQGYTTASLGARESTVVRVQGDVGPQTGSGSTQVYTQLGSRSRSYVIR